LFDCYCFQIFFFVKTTLCNYNEHVVYVEVIELELLMNVIIQIYICYCFVAFNFVAMWIS